MYLYYRERIPSHLLSPKENQGRNYDRDTIRVARIALAHNPNFVDAGAHLGTVLKKLLAVKSSGKQYAFEPLPSFAESLRNRFPRVHVEAIALADYEGHAEFNYIIDDPANSSLFRRTERETNKKVARISVPVKRLDDCIPENIAIGFMKIDVEGGELALLNGASRILKHDKPVVVVECASARLSDLVPVFEAAGMRVHLLVDYLSGTLRPSNELLRIARERGEYYFVATPQ
jgi:FkbM family methyltransferase